MNHKRHFRFLEGVQAIFDRFRTLLILSSSAIRRGTLSTSVEHFFSSFDNIFIWMRFTSTSSCSLTMWRAHMLFHVPLWVLYPFGGHFRNHPTTSKGSVPPFWHITAFQVFFLQQQLHHNVSVCSICQYSRPETRIPKPVLCCHRKWFASLFCVSAILLINWTISVQIWKKLLFFQRKVTSFVLAKQIWIPYDQNSNFFLHRISLWRLEVGPPMLKRCRQRFTFIWKL